MASNVKEEYDDPLYSCLPESDCNHPWLVIFDGDKFARHAFYSVSKDQHLKKEIPELRNKQVLQASYGWWLLIDDDQLDCCLMNPKTMEKIQLPKVVEYNHYRCTLSKPPTETDCYILLVGTSSILFCRLGDDKFIQRSCDIDGGYLMTATNFQGKIFASMGVYRGIVTVDFVNGDLVLKNLVKKDGQSCGFPYTINSDDSSITMVDDNLIESCGELLLVHLICCPSRMTKVLGFRIFRIDMTLMEWQELHTIGHRAIFLGCFGSMAMSLPSKEIGAEKDSIYYINREENDKSLYVHHIKDQTQTLLLPFREVDGAHSLKSWIMI